ncbi:MAG: hypothetical protein AAF184_16930, partial [Pseudomonadota bacterium]
HPFGLLPNNVVHIPSHNRGHEIWNDHGSRLLSEGQAVSHPVVDLAGMEFDGAETYRIDRILGFGLHRGYVCVRFEAQTGHAWGYQRVTRHLALQDGLPNWKEFAENADCAEPYFYWPLSTCGWALWRWLAVIWLVGLPMAAVAAWRMRSARGAARVCG